MAARLALSSRNEHTRNVDQSKELLGDRYSFQSPAHSGTIRKISSADVTVGGKGFLIKADDENNWSLNSPVRVYSSRDRPMTIDSETISLADKSFARCEDCLKYRQFLREKNEEVSFIIVHAHAFSFFRCDQTASFFMKNCHSSYLKSEDWNRKVLSIRR